MRQDAAGQPAAAPAAGAKPADEPKVERKIIFNGALELVVKDFDATRQQLTELVAANGGYLAKSDVVGDAGAKRTGTFTVKVPAEKFQATVDALTKFGVAVKNATDSQDVTEEFVDVAARVRNLKAEEEVLNKLLKDAAGRLDDVFKIREQIRTVRGDIERAEGRLKVLTALTSLSTITVTVREEANYVPPTVEAPPTFATRLSGTFDNSLATLRELGETVLIVLVAVAPWVPVAVAFGLVVRWLARHLPNPVPPESPRVAKRLRTPEPPPAPVPPVTEPTPPVSDPAQNS